MVHVIVRRAAAHDTGETRYVGPFDSEDHAREYARRRTRDSLERLRRPNQSREALRLAWLIDGECCSVADGEFTARDELDYYIDHPATRKERDYAALAPDASSAT